MSLSKDILEYKTVYLVAMCLLGLLCSFALFLEAPSIPYTHLAFFTALNFFFSLLGVNLPSGMHLSLSYPFSMGLFLVFGPFISFLVMVPGTLANGIRRQRPLLVILFNIFQYAISLFLAHQVFQFLGGMESGLILSQHWYIIALTFFTADVSNNLFVSIALYYFGYGKLKDLFIKSLITDMTKIIPVYYTIGIILALSYETQGLPGIVLVSLPLLSIFFILRDQEVILKSKKQAEEDALTGLYNRRYLDRWFDEHLEGILGQGQDLVAMLMDIDDFKQFNDTYGHQDGDKALQTIAQAIKKSVRDSDLVFRYGGEEFVVLLPGANCEIGSDIGQRICATIRNTPLETGSFLTVSIGMASLMELDPDEQNQEQLIRQADNAAYLAKFQGKDQLCTHHTNSTAQSM